MVSLSYGSALELCAEQSDTEKELIDFATRGIYRAKGYLANDSFINSGYNTNASRLTLLRYLVFAQQGRDGGR